MRGGGGAAALDAECVRAAGVPDVEDVRVGPLGTGARHEDRIVPRGGVPPEAADVGAHGAAAADEQGIGAAEVAGEEVQGGRPAGVRSGDRGRVPRRARLGCQVAVHRRHDAAVQDREGVFAAREAHVHRPAVVPSGHGARHGHGVARRGALYADVAVDVRGRGSGFDLELRRRVGVTDERVSRRVDRACQGEEPSLDDGLARVEVGFAQDEGARPELRHAVRSSDRRVDRRRDRTHDVDRVGRRGVADQGQVSRSRQEVGVGLEAEPGFGVDVNRDADIAGQCFETGLTH